MEKSCETCGFLRDGFLCGLDGVDIRIGHCEKYKAWKPKDVNQDVVQNDLLKFSDICLGACSDKSCSTCSCYVGEGGFCGGTEDCWEAKTSETIEEWVARSAKDAPMPGCVLTGSGAQSLKTGTFVFKTTLTDTQKKISEICDEIKNLLLEKNRKYGDSALNPRRVFSKASPIEQINVRIDDKISRIMSAQDDDIEDAELDLIGYMILKRVAKRAADDIQ